MKMVGRFFRGDSGSSAAACGGEPNAVKDAPIAEIRSFIVVLFCLLSWLSVSLFYERQI
jgi:hypothetical protein